MRCQELYSQLKNLWYHIFIRYFKQSQGIVSNRKKRHATKNRKLIFKMLYHFSADAIFWILIAHWHTYLTIDKSWLFMTFILRHKDIHTIKRINVENVLAILGKPHWSVRILVFNVLVHFNVLKFLTQLPFIKLKIIQIVFTQKH